MYARHNTSAVYPLLLNYLKNGNQSKSYTRHNVRDSFLGMFSSLWNAF